MMTSGCPSKLQDILGPSTWYTAYRALNKSQKNSIRDDGIPVSAFTEWQLGPLSSIYSGNAETPPKTKQTRPGKPGPDEAAAP